MKEKEIPVGHQSSRRIAYVALSREIMSLVNTRPDEMPPGFTSEVTLFRPGSNTHGKRRLDHVDGLTFGELVAISCAESGNPAFIELSIRNNPVARRGFPHYERRFRAKQPFVAAERFILKAMRRKHPEFSEMNLAEVGREILKPNPSKS